MNSIILHHYDESPYSEKIRAILGFKGLDWISVITPKVVPKENLTALTGGYRKAPVLQIGNDIYCDTKLIADKLEEISASPTLFPQGFEATTRFMADWSDLVLFRLASILIFRPSGQKSSPSVKMDRKELIALMKDRSKMMEGANVVQVSPELAANQFKNWMIPLEKQLKETKQFLVCSDPSLADFAVYHSLWFISQNESAKVLLEEFPEIRGWIEKMKSFSKSPQKTITGVEAIEVAKTSQSSDKNFQVEHSKFQAGSAVFVSATDYGFEPSDGKLVGLNDSEIVIEREDSRTGKVFVHFPVYGFRIEEKKESSD